MTSNDYDLEETKKIWEIIKPIKGRLEIRLTPLKKDVYLPTYFNNLKRLAEELKNLNTLINKKVCFFIKTFKELKIILSFKQGYFSKNSKICYGVNERFEKKDGCIDGSYDSLKEYRLLFFDVERKDHEDITTQEFNKLFSLYVDWLKNCLRIDYKLKHPVLVKSGAGTHLLYLIQSQKITEARKEWLKEFVKEVSDKYNKNENYEVDCIADATRVLGLPGSMNNKRERMVKIDTFSNYVNSFKIKSKKRKKLKFAPIIKKTAKEIVEEPLTKMLLKNRLPEGGRNNCLIFQLKILLKNSGFVEGDEFVQELFRRISIVQEERFPSNLPKNVGFFSKNVVNKWCEKNGFKFIYK